MLTVKAGGELEDEAEGDGEADDERPIALGLGHEHLREGPPHHRRHHDGARSLRCWRARGSKFTNPSEMVKLQTTKLSLQQLLRRWLLARYCARCGSVCGILGGISRYLHISSQKRVRGLTLLGDITGYHSKHRYSRIHLLEFISSHFIFSSRYCLYIACLHIDNFTLIDLPFELSSYFISFGFIILYILLYP